jgi:5-hydroxyisourate hydrolase
MTTLSTHILDTSTGRPAPGVVIDLSQRGNKRDEGDFGFVTDADGRCHLPVTLYPGDYTLTFHVGDYFAARNQPTLYPVITITFTISPGEPRYHIPLLLNPFGYTTYRGT